jgi:fatty acid desaturase
MLEALELQASDLSTPEFHLSKGQERVPMLWTLVVVLVVLWALGLIGGIGGGLLHTLLVLAVIVIAINLLSGRRGTI